MRVHLDQGLVRRWFTDRALIGTKAHADDNKTRKIGCVGGKHYVRLTVTPANSAGNFFLAAVALLGHPRNAPTPNPPV